MNNRKPIVLKSVELNPRRTINLAWSSQYHWTPLSDLNFVELWQKSESVDTLLSPTNSIIPTAKAIRLVVFTVPAALCES